MAKGKRWKWTERQQLKLERLWADGLLVRDIARALRRSTQAVTQQAIKMGLPPRRRGRRSPSPALEQGPPSWWKANKEIRDAGTVYPRGSALTSQVICKPIFATLVRLGQAIEVHGPKPEGMPQPRKVEEPAPAPITSKPPVEIVHDADPVTSAIKTIDLHTAKCGGDRGRARDLLACHPEANELIQRAVSIDAKRRSDGNPLMRTTRLL